MTIPSPRDAAPDLERRKQLVADVLTSLEDCESADLAQQQAIFTEAQTVLSGLLQSGNDISQLGIPGISGQ